MQDAQRGNLDVDGRELLHDREDLGRPEAEAADALRQVEAEDTGAPELAEEARREAPPLAQVVRVDLLPREHADPPAQRVRAARVSGGARVIRGPTHPGVPFVEINHETKRGLRRQGRPPVPCPCRARVKPPARCA